MGLNLQWMRNVPQHNNGTLDLHECRERTDR